MEGMGRKIKQPSSSTQRKKKVLIIELFGAGGVQIIKDLC